MSKRAVIGSALAIALAAASVAALPGGTQDNGAQDKGTPTNKGVAAAPVLPPNVISADVPSDIPGGAPNADLTTAAVFAWQEFIALNWPALTQSNGKPLRDTADTSKPFGNPKETGPLVWHTYRGKVEIFPGTGENNTPGQPPSNFPPGYTNDSTQSYGYDAPPQYLYSPSKVGTPTGAISACDPAQQGDSPPWINLDETTQIGLDSMYFGIQTGSPGQNPDPQRFRFLAKANRKEYEYVAKNNYWWKSTDFTKAQDNLTAAIGFNAKGMYTNPTSYTYPNSPFLSFSDNTIEVKAAWRPLAKGDDPTRFYTTKVRYYNSPETDKYCYVDDTWALAALHIIQKTPTAPYFVFATFEQADNLLTTVNGQTVPVEDDNGTVIHPSTAGPTTPAVTYHPSPTDATVTADGPFCGDQQGRLNYQELGFSLPTGGRICVNQRTNAIPAPVIAVNAAFHDSIQSYAKSQGFASTPWLHYKLVNVQWVPFDQSSIDPSDPNGPKNPATYHLANIVVETDNTLQGFSGRLTAGGAHTDYPPPVSGKPPTQPNFKNTFIIPQNGTAGQPIQAFNMGGCMGCHGQSNSRTDISFILNGGPVPFPDTAAPQEQPKIIRRYRSLFGAK